MLHTKQPEGGDDMFEKADASKLKDGRGQFTGQTADYLAGRADEPETITLESARLVRKSPNIVNILGRKVSVCGVKKKRAGKRRRE